MSKCAQLSNRANRAIKRACGPWRVRKLLRSFMDAWAVEAAVQLLRGSFELAARGTE